MKNKKRLNQKIQNKRNKRKSRKTPFPFGLKPYGFKSVKRERVKLDSIAPMHEIQRKTQEEGMRNRNQTTFRKYGEYVKRGNPQTGEMPICEPNKNAIGYAVVDLGRPSDAILNHLESPPPTNVTLRDIKLINDQRFISPNGNQIPYTSWSIKDSFFEGKDLNEEVMILRRMLKNSTYFCLHEKDGFTEEILNDVNEMEKYLFWTIRTFFTTINLDCSQQSHPFVDCPLDLYSELFFSEKVPLKLVS